MANTVQNFSGYTSSRASSRVLAPPGGKSSDIFGFVNAAPAAAPAASTASQAIRNKSNVFDAPQAKENTNPTPVVSKTAPVASPSRCRSDRNKSSVFASPSKATAPTITTTVTGARASSRVLAPPGGASSGIFGF